MFKKKTLLLLLLIIFLTVTVPIMAIKRKRADAEIKSDDSIKVVTLWQIDGFEGGRGSRKDYLKQNAESCFKSEKCYVNITALTADAARLNIANGVIPDMISYPAGFWGIESLINGKDFKYKNWARGAYFIFCLDESSNFSDVTAQNTVVNSGKDNFSGVAAILNGIEKAHCEEPNNAYLKLIDGSYKYLFGTQRDYFRLKTRNVNFKMKEQTAFCDLYQNISILTENVQKYKICSKFIDYITGEDNGVGKLGLFYGQGKNLDDGLKKYLNISYKNVLNYPCSKEFYFQLKEAEKNCNTNQIKRLLKY